MSHFFIQRELIEKCFACVYKGTGMDLNGLPVEDTYNFAGNNGNPQLAVKKVPLKPSRLIIVLAAGLTEHVIYEGTKEELERKIKRIAMESSLKDETKSPHDFVPNFDEEELDEDEG
jgi:hypothetical protein